MHKQLEKTKRALLYRQHFQVKMNQLFSSLKEEGPFFPAKKPFNKNSPLFFHFQGQLDPDPNFSGDLYGKILVEEKALLLHILSKDQKRVRKEVLLQNVETLQVLFLQKKDDFFLWEVPFTKTDPCLPLAIKMICSPKKGSEVTFVFFPKQKNLTINYT